MFAMLRPALSLLILLTIITGGLYPALITLLAKIGFAHQAEGSLIIRNEKVLGSELIAQPFTDDQYFWPRPSVANYDATASAGSNYAQDNPAKVQAVAARINDLRASGINAGSIPADLITASASGLDPDISLAAAQIQIPRIAHARQVSPEQINTLVEQNLQDRSLGLLGEPRVNVLLLNLELDHLLAPSHPTDESVVGWRGRAFLPKPASH